MANRVLINSSGLKVSKPGFDVLSTADINLLFNSDWSQIKLFTKGVFSASVSGGNQSVMFGKTFNNRPLCMFWASSTGGDVQLINDHIVLQFPIGHASILWWLRVESDRFTTNVQVNTTFRYQIWDLDL